MGLFRGFVSGIAGYGKGVAWLWGHKRYLVLLIIPMILGLIVAGGTLVAFMNYAPGVMNWLLPAPSPEWYLQVLQLILQAMIWFGVLVAAFVAALLTISVISAPLYEIVSIAIERDITGGPVQELSIKASLRLIGEEIKKVLFILTITILLLCIPGLNVISSLIAAFFIGWDFYDYPLARRGWTFRQRLRFVLREFPVVTGLGLWLIVPFVHIFLMPLAVAGGTLLNLEAMKKQQLL